MENIISKNSINFQISKKHFHVFLFLLPLFIIFNIEFFGLSFLYSSYIDEVYALFLLGYILLSSIKAHDNTVLVFWFFIIFYVFLGLLGNSFNTICDFNLEHSLIDMFIFFKPYLYFFSSYIFFKRQRRHVSKFTSDIIKILLYVCFLFSIFHFISNGLNYFTVSKSNPFVMFTKKNPNTLVELIFTLLFVLFQNENHIRLRYFCLASVSVVLCATGVGYLGLALTFAFCFVTKRIRIKWWHLAFLFMLAVLIGWNEISYYLLTPGYARSELWLKGFQSGFVFFPFGAGWANYGGYGAATWYSNLYFQFGFNDVYGLTYANSLTQTGFSFLYDSYLPQVIGQFGFFGFSVFVYLIVKFFCKLFRKKDFVSISILLLLCVESIGFGITGPSSCLLLSVLGFSICQRKKKRN
ncbi:hypothetical protein DYE49_02370 [Treponema rectale]|uniref:O-antigen polymerase n=1 Tax=Treponema rectale TaxID=744512 RepID=A0A7M1XJM5_9SPIR|nr:hypothetical protein DYE49_02370 [Treponema rectale]